MSGSVSRTREVRVSELRPNLRHITVTVKVLSVGGERRVISRFDGLEHRVAEALVGDETGTVLLSLWDGDIEEVKQHEGETITLRNCYVTEYRGSMRLSLGRYGKVEEPIREIEEVNERNNMSNKPVRGYGGGRRRARRPRP